LKETSNSVGGGGGIQRN